MITAKLTRITPEQAKTWRGNSKNFRSLDKTYARRIADDIAAGRWECNGVPIVLNGNGTLIDGQHRLYAIELAGKAVETLVVSGVAEYSTIDTGKKRNLKDTLQNRGEKNAGVLAGTINWHYRLITAKAWQMTGGRAPTLPAALAILSEHPGLRDSMTKVLAKFPDLLLPVGLLSALHYLFAQKDRDMADLFVASLTSKAPDLRNTDPMHLLRSMLIQNQARRSLRATSAFKAALAIKVWNSWRSGEPMGVLKWKASGPRAEAFPSID